MTNKDDYCVKCGSFVDAAKFDKHFENCPGTLLKGSKKNEPDKSTKPKEKKSFFGKK